MDFLGSLNKLGNFAGDFSDAMYKAQLNASRIDNPMLYEKEIGTRKNDLLRRQKERDALINSGVLGSIGQNFNGFDAQGYIESGGDINTLGTLAKLAKPEPTKLEENIQTLQFINQLDPELQKQYATLFGKGGTTVNVGGNESPMASKFSEEIGKDLGKETGELRRAATDYLSQSRSAEQALNMLEANPNINISPTARIGADVKSLFSPFLDEKELKNVADFQALDSQLIRNRFDVTKVLKGAITEQEQQAAQSVAGSPTGTREGLAQTLKNNIAYSTIQADYNQRKAEYIQNIVSQGGSYSPQKFEAYYKELGEAGERPTLDSLLGGGQQEGQAQGIKAGQTIEWGNL